MKGRKKRKEKIENVEEKSFASSVIPERKISKAENDRKKSRLKVYSWTKLLAYQSELKQIKKSKSGRKAIKTKAAQNALMKKHGFVK